MSLSLKTLTSSIRNGKPILVQLIEVVSSVITFFTSDDLTHMVNFPTRISDCNSNSVLLFWMATMAFPPLGNSDHFVVSVSIHFRSNSQQDDLFHSIA